MNYALIVAAGKGTRMGEGCLPKQFLSVNNKELFIWTVERFNSNKNIDGILIVTSENYIEHVKEEISKSKLDKVIGITTGGATRQASVYNGLSFLNEKGIKEADIILIHDAARVMVDDEIINQNIEQCKKYGAVVTAIPAVDTILKVDNSLNVESVPNRDQLYQAQTPQTFNFDIIYSAHKYALKHNLVDASDDTKLMLLMNKNVHIVKGNVTNFKVTTIEDFNKLKMLMKSDS